MMNDLIDAELEDRFRAALAVMMPRLEQPVASESVDDDDDDCVWVAGNVAVGHSTRVDRLPRGRRVLTVAAGLLAMLGTAGAIVAVASRDDARPVSSSDSVALPENSAVDAAVTSPVSPVDPTIGPLLSTPVDADVDPAIAMTMAGWKVIAYSDLAPLPNVTPSASCAGCGAQRLVLTGTGPLFSAPIFTAWVLDAPYDLDLYDEPVSIGDISGRAIGVLDGSVPSADNRLRLVWPVAPGRTAFVDASGLASDEVVAMAASLGFAGPVPTLDSPPPGYAVLPTPPESPTARVRYINFESGVALAGHGTSSIELVATSAGLQGLLDWRSPSGTPIPAGWMSRTVDGVTLSVEGSVDAEAGVIIAIDARWVAGGWAYEATGHIFATEADFLSALTGLELTDDATFAATTEGIRPFSFGPATPSPDGKSAVLDDSSKG